MGYRPLFLGDTEMFRDEESWCVQLILKWLKKKCTQYTGGEREKANMAKYD